MGSFFPVLAQRQVLPSSIASPWAELPVKRRWGAKGIWVIEDSKSPDISGDFSNPGPGAKALAPPISNLQQS